MTRYVYSQTEMDFLFARSHLTYDEVTQAFNTQFGTKKTIKAIGLFCNRRGIYFKKTARAKGLKRNYKNGSPSQFQKGRSAPNKSPLGAERVRKKDSYIEIKTVRGWEMKQRVVWEREKGEIPAGNIIFFKDGNQQNCDIENLECVPRGVITIANKQYQFESYPAQMRETVFLMAQVKYKMHAHQNSCKCV